MFYDKVNRSETMYKILNFLLNYVVFTFSVHKCLLQYLYLFFWSNFVQEHVINIVVILKKVFKQN